LGADLAREKVEVCPTAHFNMGGVRINRDGFTNLGGLFAAGEDSSGVHGANRLGGNGVAESTVFGARVGEAVATWVKRQTHNDLPRQQIYNAEQAATRFVERQSGESPWSLRDELGAIMWERAGIVRDVAKLNRALEELAVLVERSKNMSASGGCQFNLTWQQALDVRNLLTASELIARSALMRQESRGAHYREDFPNADHRNWLKNIYLKQNGAAPKMWTEAVNLTKLQP
jgi:succinate dehydrogenase / fumarate reductase flavoprotein subunit/fumarate reductase flavoprotein subunit